MSLLKDIPQPDGRTWIFDEGLGETFLVGDTSLEEEGVKPLDYEQALDIGGASAVYEPPMTPDEKKLSEEQYADYAGTHEQFE